nr:ribonuclease H-like domain-containing protein [Tanacetum cinerariifolium]
MVTVVAILPLSASPGFSSSKGVSKSKCSVVDDVLYSFFVNHEIDQQLVYEDLDQMNKDKFKEYDLKHQMEMLSIKVHRFEKKHGRKIKFNGRENARFDKKLVKCFNCKQMGHFSSIDWDKQTEERNTEPRSLENFGMIARIKLESGADLEGEVVSADAIISVGLVVAAAVSPQSKTEFALMGLSTEGQPIYNRFASIDHIKAVPPPLTGNYMPPFNIPDIDESHMVYGKMATDSSEIKTNDDSISHSRDSVLFYFSDRIKLMILGLDKYIGEGKLGIDDSVFSIFHTTSDDLKGQPIYNRFSSVNHIKAVPPPLTGNYMPPFNIPDIDESHMVYGKTATDSSKIKTNDDSISHSRDSVLFYFSDSVSAPASASSDTIVIDCARQEDFPSVCTSSIKTDVKSSKTFYLHLIKDCDFYEQTFTKRNAEGKVSAGPPNPVYVGQPNLVSTGNGILGPRPLNIQSKSTYFHSFTYNNQQIIFPVNYNSLYSLYMTGGLNRKTVVKPSAGWPWTESSISTTKGSKINGGSNLRAGLLLKGNSLRMEKAIDRVCRALTMSARILNFLAFKLEEIVMAMMTCLKSSGVHYQCFTAECGLLWRCPILNCFNLGRVNMKSLAINYVSKKLHDTDPEFTL